MNKKKIKLLMISIFVTLALSLSLDLVDLNAFKIDESADFFLKVLAQFNGSINSNLPKSIIVFVFSYCLFKNNEKYKEKNNLYEVLLSLLFTIFTLFGYSYYKTNSWDLIFQDIYQLIKSIIIGAGYFFIYKGIIHYIFKILIAKIKFKETDNKFFNFIFIKHSFIMPLVIILICWLPFIISYYPGVLSADSGNQIKQYFGLDIGESTATNSVNLIDENVKITNHHPVLHTVILGSCVRIGKMLGNDNFGVFLYSIMQVSLLACTLAYCIKFMNEIRVNNYIRIFALLVFSLVPIFPFYALEITKDVPYACFNILYIVEIYKLIKMSQEEKITNKKIIYIVILLLGICLFRNNGIYTILISFPLVSLTNKTNQKILIHVSLFIVIFYELFILFILPKVFKVPNVGVREVLYIPFQQTARYVKTYNEEVTEEEKIIIDRVLNYKTLPIRYNPVNANPVKNKYNKDATNEDLKKYFVVWTNQFFKHPLVYIESFFNSYYGYIYLEADIREYTVSYLVYHDTKLEQTGEFQYHYLEGLKGLREKIKQWIEISKKIPIISWLTNIALDNWIIIGMIFYLLHKKYYKYILFLLPSLSNMLICFVSPSNGTFRYAIPNKFAMFLLISIFISVINDKD